MSIEPGIAGMVERINAEALTDWDAYRKCPTCGALTGEACFAMYARVENGRPAGGRKRLTIAHGHRRTRSGR